MTRGRGRVPRHRDRPSRDSSDSASSKAAMRRRDACRRHRPPAPHATSARTRGAGSSREQPRASRSSGRSTSARPRSATPSLAGAGVRRRSAQSSSTPRTSGRGRAPRAAPGPPSRTCSASPDRRAVRRLSAYRRRIPITTSGRDDRGPDPEPEDRLQAAQTGGEEQQDAGQDRPDLPGDAVDEAEHLGASIGRDDVVERAPGCVGDATLGDLLAESECSRGGERELHEPCREPERRTRAAEASAPAEIPNRA